jgi:hypothetical protein
MFIHANNFTVVAHVSRNSFLYCDLDLSHLLALSSTPLPIKLEAKHTGLLSNHLTITILSSLTTSSVYPLCFFFMSLSGNKGGLENLLILTVPAEKMFIL